MSHPRVTVIMPCYNAAATIGMSIESVLAQSFFDFELLVVDDGSRDASVSVANGLASRDGRVRVICQANAGPAAARNLGVEQARGEVLAFLDADDRWAPDLLVRHLAQFAANRLCGVSFARIRFFDPTMTQGGRVSAAFKRLNLVQVLGENPVCTTSNLVARRAVFDEVGGFDPELTHGEDQEWVARVLALTNWQLCGLAQILVDYRTSLGGLSADLRRMSEGWAAMLRRVQGYAPRELATAAPGADALFHRYLARRALRTDQPAACLRPMIRAWRASPRALLTCQPRRTLLTMLGVFVALLPGKFGRGLLAR